MKIKNILMCVIFALIFAGFSLMCILKPPGEYSQSERRLLAQKPLLSVESVLSGKYMADFEKYATDQVPFRENFKTVKAHFVLNVLNKKDNNGIFLYNGHVSKLDGELNDAMINHATEKFENIYNTYLKDKDMNVFLSIIPDKNYYLAQFGYPSLDYESLIANVQEKLPYMSYIDITGLLELEDYYKTDSHWKMECILPVADKIAQSMGRDMTAEYETLTLDNPFMGVYGMQSSLVLPPDTIRYLTNATIEGATVTYYDGGAGVEGEVYNMEKAYGKDPYEMFLSGSTPLCVIENPAANTTKELILFRDSFGSSLAPLLIEGYSKITIIDIRYVQSAYLSHFVDFSEGSDVLFLYSTMLLNNSMALR